MQAERVIAAARLILALVSLVALQLDGDVHRAMPVVASAAVYAVALAAVAWLWPHMAVRYRLAVHAADFLLYSLLVYFTHAAVSPFFVFFLFSVFCALLRFGVRGTLVTAGMAILTYATLALLDDRMHSDPAYLVVRVAALCVAALLLSYAGAFHERLRKELALSERKRAAAAGEEERLRVSRDLHDGLLQSLTGAALQLEAVHKLVGVDDAAVRQRVRRVQELIENDQRELRLMISELRPNAGGAVPSLGARLLDLAERFERQWEVAVSVYLDPPLPELSDEMASEIYSLVSEAVANAAKHARASRIDVTLRSADGGRTEITIEDDGRGFAFHGQYDLRALDELRRGPVTLKERVASLGGELRLQSSPEGATLQIRI